MNDNKIAAIVTICLTIAFVALVAGLTHSCQITNEIWQQQAAKCLETGGTILPNNSYGCVHLRENRHE